MLRLLLEDSMRDLFQNPRMSAAVAACCTVLGVINEFLPLGSLLGVLGDSPEEAQRAATFSIWAEAVTLCGVSAFTLWRQRRAQRRASRVPRVYRAPGSLLLQVASFFFSAGTIRGVFEPWVADFRHEQHDDHLHKRVWRARMTALRHRWIFWQHFAMQVVASVAKPIAEMWKSFGS